MTRTAPSAPARALITGSAAPFAQRLVDRLRSHGWEVRTIAHADQEPLPPTHSLHVPVPASQELAAAASEADAVVLLSGLDSLTSMVDDSQDLDQILGNMKPGACLVEVSTMAIFGDAGHAPVTEQHRPVVPAELDPVAACELRVLAANDWIRGVVVRPGLVYGSGGGLALEAAVDLARSTGVSRYFGHGSESLPTVHEDDLLDLMTLAIEDDTARGTYHANSGSVTTRELADAVAAAAGIAGVEAWTLQTLQAVLGARREPPRVDIPGAGAGRAMVELGWRPAAPPLSQALSR